jgi:membrane glycosyltransferase
VLIGFFPIIGGFAGSVLIVRFTSRTFSSIRSRGLFCIPEEIDTPAVLQDMRRWERRLRAKLVSANDRKRVLADIVGDPGFYVRHRRETRRRPRAARILLPKINSHSLLSDREIALALRERSCFDALHKSLQEDGPRVAEGT